MNRKSEDFAPGQYLIALSPDQLDELLGAETGATVTDHFCRVNPADSRELDLWIKTGDSGRFYEAAPVDRPRNWEPYTVEAVYYDNDQPYTQTVLAVDHGEAEEIAGQVANFSNRGRDKADEEFESPFDPDSIEVSPGYGEDSAPVSVRNAHTFPDQLVQVAAWVLLDPRYQRFVAEDGPYGAETFREGVERVTRAALAFFNELPQDAANHLQDEDCARFQEAFFAAHP